LENTIKDQGLTGNALDDVHNVISLLEQESSLVSGINTATPTQVSAINGQIGQIETHILNIINHDPTLAAMAAGADGTTGFVALPPTSGHDNVAIAQNTTLPDHGVHHVAADHNAALPGHADMIALAALHHTVGWGH
jgi:hypothetical protein